MTKLKKDLRHIASELMTTTVNLREIVQAMHDIIPKKVVPKLPKESLYDTKDYFWIGLGFRGEETNYFGYARQKVGDLSLRVERGKIYFTNSKKIEFAISRSGSTLCPYPVTEAYIYTNFANEEPYKRIALPNGISITKGVTPLFAPESLFLNLDGE